MIAPLTFYKPVTREAPSNLLLKVKEIKKKKLGCQSNQLGQVKQKKSLVSMLKKIDGKLLDVLRKNSGLLKKEELKSLKENPVPEDETHMVPKDLSSRRFKKTNKSSDCLSTRRQKNKSTTDLQNKTSYIQLDLTNNKLPNKQGIYLAQPNYRSTFVCTLADGTIPAIQKCFSKERVSLSNSLSSLKKIGKAESLKRLPLDPNHQISPIHCEKRAAISKCNR